MLEDDGVIANKSGAFAKATSVDPEIGPSRAINSHTRGEPKVLGCSDAPPTAEPLNKPPKGPTSPNRPLPQDPSRGVVCEDDRSRTAVGIPPGATISPPQQCEAQFSALEVKEWEIRRLVGKRRVGRAYEYKVRWKDTWLSESEI